MKARCHRTSALKFFSRASSSCSDRISAARVMSGIVHCIYILYSNLQKTIVNTSILEIINKE